MEKVVKRNGGFGASVLRASPQPLSGGEGLSYPADSVEGASDCVAFEGRPPYKTSDRIMWSTLKENARENRQEQTEAERIMWQALRGNKLGHKIRRQHPIDIYIADFICIRKRTIIEIDGDYHLTEEQQQYDSQRSFYIAQKGFRVIRFRNQEVETNLEYVLNNIKSVLDSIADLERDW